MSERIIGHTVTINNSLQRQHDALTAIARPHSAQSLQRSVHVSLKYRYLFCQIPKAACSTIKLTLVRAELEAMIKRYHHLDYDAFAF